MHFRRSAVSIVIPALVACMLFLQGVPTYALAEQTDIDQVAEEEALEAVQTVSEGLEGDDAPQPDEDGTVEEAPIEDGVEDDALDVGDASDPLALEAQATARDLLNDEIWIRQGTSGECTLASAAMMLRRAAILNGVSDWRSITDESIRGVAWTSIGLRWSFTYRGMSVAEKDLGTSSEQVLIGLLESHPEGIVAYTDRHTVLLTDYTDGVLYCADPAYGDRRPLSSADQVRANNVTQYWYVTSSVDEVEPEDGGRTGDGPHVAYRTHVQNVGWQSFRADGAMSGTAGRSLRLEGIEIKLEDLPTSGGISYRTHVQNIGWQDWVSDGAMSGTSGRSLRLEAIQIKLTGELAQSYDVYYRVHAQNIGWMGWAKNGEQAGTATFGYRLEGIQVVLVRKGDAAPGTTFLGIAQATSEAFRQRNCQYRTHVQNVGWQNWSYDGQMAGTSGRSLRLEGIEISLQGAPYAGSIEYCTHVQNVGWQDWVADGAMSGTSGRSLRLEGIRIRLTGEMAEHYDVYYRVHAQNIGWMGWAKNGSPVGTAGFSYRLEAIQIVLVGHGSAAPGATYQGITQQVGEAFSQKA